MFCVCVYVSTYLLAACVWVWIYVGLYISYPITCGSLSVAQECISVLSSVEKKQKQSLLQFEEPNQRPANFPRLLYSSEAAAGLLFLRLPPFCSLLSRLFSSLITKGAAGGLSIAVETEERASS